MAFLTSDALTFKVVNQASESTFTPTEVTFVQVLFLPVFGGTVLLVNFASKYACSIDEEEYHTICKYCVEQSRVAELN